ncbi:uncharacterized protein LOC123523340 [Mercenaria mercenaria]|uniref:uncharacterized protein LOC123523340 n=1 Tax=Mercenaria mercenaria TaxID=6596 RepID=UPI00234EE538|nr:uncharacterized protein LOC123523340 [Mercenaria mercenaria]
MAAEMRPEEGRRRAILPYKTLAGVSGLLGAGLLACGIKAVLSNKESHHSEMPYFLGGFVVGTLVLITAAVCGVISLKAPDANSEMTKKKVGTMMQVQNLLAVFTIFGCIPSCAFAGMAAFSSTGFFKGENGDVKTLATIILAGCIAAFFLAFVSGHIITKYSSYFGLIIKHDIRGNRVFINTGGTAVMPLTTDYSLFQAGPHMTGDQLHQLQTQNNLHQHYLMQQQQQQQQQQPLRYSTGLYQPQPPPPPPPQQTQYSRSLYHQPPPPPAQRNQYSGGFHRPAY